VSLDVSWRAILELGRYPAPVRAQLGQALAATALLSATVKFQGSMILQIRSSGPLRTLVAQATDQRQLRGLARWEGEVPDATLVSVFGDGYLVLTVEPRNGKRYQGTVALDGNSLADALNNYFIQSEQLATRLWLSADARRASGLLLQALPEPEAQREDWVRLTTLAATASAGELVTLPTEGLLYRLFNEEPVRLLDPEPVSFRCTCSRQRVADTLQALGKGETDAIIDEQGSVEVDCEFCNRHYSFDAVDVEQIFASGLRRQAPARTQ
jgi:molecular chaperone Hsp33